MSSVWELWSAAAGDAGRELLAGPDAVTAGELDGRIRATAGALAGAWNVRPGEVIALFAPNGAAFVEGYFAAQHRGAVVLPLDLRLTDADLTGMLAHSGAVGMLAAPEFSARASRLGRSAATPLPIRLLGGRGDTGEAPSGDHAPVALPADAPAELLYTSGTTATPKGVLRSHANVLAAVRQARTAFGYRADDTLAVVMPLSHSSALVSQLLPVLQAGGRVVLLPQFDPVSLLDAVADTGVTCTRLVPSMVRLLLAEARFHEEELPSLRLIVNSSAPIAPDTYRELKRRFPSVAVLNSYGLTEASTCTVLPDQLALSHAASVGAAIPGVRIRVCGEDGHELPPGVEGEIQIAGPHVFMGYHRDPEATAAARAGEWLRTGDLGRQDDDGLLYVHGRLDDMINCGGRKISPEEVERCVVGAPGVRDAACTAMPHRVLGEVVHAFVVPADPLTFDPRAVVRHCAGSLPSHMVPFEVTAVTELPRNAVGKLLRRRLRARA